MLTSEWQGHAGDTCVPDTCLSRATVSWCHQPGHRVPVLAVPVPIGTPGAPGADVTQGQGEAERGPYPRGHRGTRTQTQAPLQPLFRGNGLKFGVTSRTETYSPAGCLGDVPAWPGPGAACHHIRMGKADSAERWHRTTSSLQPLAVALGQAEGEAGLNTGRCRDPHLPV